MKRPIKFLIIGESGSGKTNTVQQLEKLGYPTLNSYTTRRPRYDGETGHLFTSVANYKIEKMVGNVVAWTIFDDNIYFSTLKQLEACSTYVVDIKGAMDLLEGFGDTYKFISIYINTTKLTRYKRMRLRGDSFFNTRKRIIHDIRAFEHIRNITNYCVNGNNSVELVMKDITTIVNEETLQWQSIKY